MHTSTELPAPAPLVRSSTAQWVVIGPYDPLREVQYDIWWRFLIAGPTRMAAGAKGNDFPGIYFFEPRTNTEHFLFYDGPVDWRVTDCSLRVQAGQVCLGYWSQAELTGQVRYHSQRRAGLPERWEALQSLIGWCLQFLPPPPPPATLPDYQPIAAAAMDEALDPELGLMTVAGRSGHRMYIAGTSDVWQDSQVDHLEMLCHSDITWALAFQQRQGHLQQHRAWLDHLIDLTGAFFSPRHQVFSNAYPVSDHDLHGGNVVTTRQGEREATNVWYHLFNHARLLEIARLEGAGAWHEPLRQAVDTTVRLAQANHYHFPLFWWLDSGEPYGGLDDFGSAGPFAWMAIRAYELYGDERYLEQAALALKTLRRFPLDQIYGEATLVARAAWAAHALHRHTGAAEWLQLREAFTAGALRMAYWQAPHLGMFQACAGMACPAIFENVHIMLAFDPFLEDSSFPLRTLLGHQLLNNQQFFNAIAPGAHVPIENLHTTEYPFGGQAGKEIYGVGEVLWLPYLHARYANQSACLTL